MFVSIVWESICEDSVLIDWNKFLWNKMLENLLVFLINKVLLSDRDISIIILI